MPSPETIPATDGTSAFAAGLFDPAQTPPTDTKTAWRQPLDDRYNVYRNNATTSLMNALADIFPACKRIVGEQNFTNLAREHVRKHPPRSKLLFHYGDQYPAFIEAHAIGRHLPYLADVARVERAWLTALHAADDAVMTPQDLAAIDPAKLADMRFPLHAATHAIASAFPVFSIFAMNRDMMELAPVNMGEAQAILLTRPDCDVRVTGINAATVQFLEAFRTGATLSEAVVSTTDAHPDFNLQAALSVCLSHGAFKLPDPSNPPQGMTP